MDELWPIFPMYNKSTIMMSGTVQVDNKPQPFDFLIKHITKDRRDQRDKRKRGQQDVRKALWMILVEIHRSYQAEYTS